MLDTLATLGSVKTEKLGCWWISFGTRVSIHDGAIRWDGSAALCICDSATVGILLTDEDAKCKIWTSLDKKHNSQQTNGIAILSAFNVKSELEKQMNLSKAKRNNQSDQNSEIQLLKFLIFLFIIDRCLSNSRACYGVFETIRIKPLCKSYFSDGTLKSPVFFYMKFVNHQ